MTTLLAFYAENHHHLLLIGDVVDAVSAPVAAAWEVRSLVWGWLVAIAH